MEIIFTIIIPHYNAAHFLNKLLLSIPMERNDLQIIIVDDRSNEDLDELKKIRNRYQKRIEFYRNNTGKKGAGAARNIGLKHAKGRWLIFADSDDYFSDNFPALLDKYKESERDIIYFSAGSIDSLTGKETERHIKIEKLVYNYSVEPNKENEIKLKYEFVEPVCKFIKRDLIVKNRIRFSESLAANDKWFSVQTAFYSKSIEVCNEVVYIIVRHDLSLTQKKDLAAYNDRMKEGLRRLVFLKRNLCEDEWDIVKKDSEWLFTSAANKGYPMPFIMKWLLIYLLYKVPSVNVKQLIDIIYTEIINAKHAIFPAKVHNH